MHDGTEAFVSDLENRDRKDCDFELLSKMQGARDTDLRYDAFHIDPYKIGEGERMLKMDLLERMMLTELGYNPNSNLQQVAKSLGTQLHPKKYK